LADSTDFQGGILTNGNAQIEFYCRGRNNEQDPAVVKAKQLRVYGIYFQDSTLVIRGAPLVGGQQINITNAYVRDIKNGNDK